MNFTEPTVSWSIQITPASENPTELIRQDENGSYSFYDHGKWVTITGQDLGR